MKAKQSSCPVPYGIAFSWRSLLVFSLALLMLAGNRAQAQQRKFLAPDTVYNAKRVKAVALVTGGIYVASMAGLYNLWYKDYPLNSLHAFNDNGEWYQMDKAGHIGSAYYLGKMGIGLLNWTGMNRKKAIWYGGLMGAFFQTSIEVLDGLSPAWGFSWGDVAANAIGSAMLISQELVWNEQRIQFKFSFHQTQYAPQRPEVLGNGFLENMFKDYNGQTYWLSCNISSFLPPDSRFPKWLNIAGGYGAEGMTGAFSNPYPGLERYRQIYIAPDIDLTRIKTRSRFLKVVFYTVSFLKFPLPAIEFDVPGKVKFVPIAF